MGINVGVPPPKKMVFAGLPLCGLLRISDTIARDVLSITSPFIAYELKSQYPHFEGQNGT